MNASQQIVQAANQLFIQYGIKSVTLDEVARRSGIPRKTLHAHFANKEALLDEIVKQNLSWYTDQFDEINKRNISPVEKIARMYELILSQQKLFHPSVYRIIARSFPNSLKAIDFFQHDLNFKRVPSLLNEAKKQNQIHADIPTELVSELYNLFLQRTTHGDFYELLNRDFKSTFNHLVLFNLRGLLTDKYRKLLDEYTFAA